MYHDSKLLKFFFYLVMNFAFFCIICSNPKLYGCFNGTVGLEEHEFRTDFAYIWISVGALVAISVTLWALTYILLRCAKKHK